MGELEAFGFWTAWVPGASARFPSSGGKGQLSSTPKNKLPPLTLILWTASAKKTLQQIHFGLPTPLLCVSPSDGVNKSIKGNGSKPPGSSLICHRHDGKAVETKHGEGWGWGWAPPPVLQWRRGCSLTFCGGAVLALSLRDAVRGGPGGLPALLRPFAGRFHWGHKNTTVIQGQW